MPDHIELRPGDPAPHSGSYQAYGVAGNPTGYYTRVDVGHDLPVLPRGFAWRPATAASQDMGQP
jgi:hypothetical protein